MYTQETDVGQIYIADKPQPHFDWIGLLALIIGIDVPIRLVASPLDGGLALVLRLTACLLVLIAFTRRYDWKNGAAALLLICTFFHPVRFIFDWWINPIIYGLATTVCVVLIFRIMRRYYWKNFVMALLIVCALLSGLQTLVSASEMGYCGLEDQHGSLYYLCSTTRQGYQQIGSLPIGMTGYCHFCPWHKGVLIPW